MNYLVTGKAVLRCSFGSSPSSLNVLPQSRVFSCAPLASIMDKEPMLHIMPFGMCSCLANPAVAAGGMFLPAPCVPVCPAPWVPGHCRVLVGGRPALTQTSKLLCAWGGAIAIESLPQENITTNG